MTGVSVISSDKTVVEELGTHILKSVHKEVGDHPRSQSLRLHFA